MLTLSGINPWAVLLAGLASFLIGGVWYAVIFGKGWARAYRLSEEKLSELGKSVVWTMPTMFVCEMMSALVVGVLVVSLDITGVLQGGALGLLLWFGLTTALGFVNHIGAGRPLRGFPYDAGKHAVSLAAVGAILSCWR